MNVLFVHGFGGARGALERAMFAASRDSGHSLVPVRWASGDLRELRARAVVEVARRVAEKKSLSRGLVEAALAGTRHASQAWEQAVANVPSGAAGLAHAVRASKGRGEDVAVVSFSLGCRVVLHALAADADLAPAVSSFVFAGSAAPAEAFTALGGPLARGVPVAHVFSRRDAVLDRLYPLGGGSVRPSGREPLAMQGVANVEVDVGHRGYVSIADRLWRLATGDEETARDVAPAVAAARGATRAIPGA